MFVTSSDPSDEIESGRENLQDFYATNSTEIVCICQTARSFLLLEIILTFSICSWIVGFRSAWNWRVEDDLFWRLRLDDHVISWRVAARPGLNRHWHNFDFRIRFRDTICFPDRVFWRSKWKMIEFENYSTPRCLHRVLSLAPWCDMEIRKKDLSFGFTWLVALAQIGGFWKTVNKDRCCSLSCFDNVWFFAATRRFQVVLTKTTSFQISIFYIFRFFSGSLTLSST